MFSILSLLRFFSCCIRYHYNVADVRLHQHVEKGNEDGLYISCVASSANLWALIMDAGTGFCSQEFELSSVFLHKVCLLHSSVIFAAIPGYLLIKNYIEWLNL